MRAREMLYKEVVQTVMLYGRDSWVVMEAMMKVLEALHHQIDSRITGKTAW